MTEAMRILQQIGQALQHAHEQNVIHRDLKPANILFQATSWGTKGFWLCDPFRNILIFEESIPEEESDTEQGA